MTNQSNVIFLQAGAEQKPAAGRTPLRLLHRLHDLCAPQPAAVGDPGGLQPGAGGPSGNTY